MRFNSFIIPAANYGLLSGIILSGSSCSFQMLFLNNCASPSMLVFSVVGMKYAIFVNLSITTCNDKSSRDDDLITLNVMRERRELNGVS